jgi:hypothetical protein
MFDDDSSEEFDDRQCLGITLEGNRCKISACGSYTSYALREAAESLRFGDYCGYHVYQKYNGSDGDESSEEEEGVGKADKHTKAKMESRLRVKAGSEPYYIGLPGASYEYALVVATGGRLPRVAKSTNLPAWVTASNDSWRADHDPCLPAIKCFNGLIVHKPTDAVVGYMSGYMISRRPGVIADCDAHSQSAIDLLTDIFDFGHRGDSGELMLKPQHKLVGCCPWGGTLDAGRFAYLERMELVPNHRGKGVLAKLADPLLRFCKQHSIASVITIHGFLSEPRISTPAALARNTGNVVKLGDGLAKLGFRALGTEGWMAMVANRRHPCWDPNTYQRPEFPFREVAKTVNDRSMPTILKACIAARRSDKADFPDMMRRREYKADDRDDDELLVAARAALDAIKAHDPGALFIPAETKGHAGPARLMAQLLWEKSAWKAHKLAPGIERLHDALLDFYR